jgi:anti-anti-sigma factor
MALSIETRSIDDITVLSCNGRIVDGDESSTLAAAVDKLLPLQPCVVLDLRGVSFIDSAGVGLLLRLRTLAQRAAGDVKICAAPPRFRELLHVTTLDGVLRPHDSAEEAIGAFKSSTGARKDQSSLEVDVVLVHPSADVLVYGSELLKRAGYRARTASNVSDARVLVRAMQPKAVVIAPDMHPRLIERGADIVAGMQVLLLSGEFSRADPGEAGRRLLADLSRAFARESA